MYIMYCDQKFSVKYQTFLLKKNYFRKKNKLKCKKEHDLFSKHSFNIQEFSLGPQADHSMLPHLFPKLFFPPTLIKHQRLTR